MKTFHYKYIVVFTFIIMSAGLYAQVNTGYLTGRKWKLDQLYANKVRVNSPRADSVKYEFWPNGIMRAYEVNTTDSVEMNYTIANDSLIISDTVSNVFRYKLIYLNENFLIYLKNYTDTTTNTPVETEFRFISVE